MLISEAVKHMQQLAHGASSDVTQQDIKLSNCIPDCPVCGGLGLVRVNLPISDPRFGKLQPCPNNNDIFRLHGTKLGLDEVDRRITWDSLIDYGSVRTAREAIQTVLRRGYGWVYLFGDFGTSKTSLLKIAVAEAVRSGKLGAYTRMAEIMDNLKEAFGKDNESAIDRLEWWSSVPVLAIDEMEKIQQSEYTTDRRFLLMDRRYEDAWKGRSITVIAGNVPPESLDKAIRDRIRDGRFFVVHMDGTSIRPHLRGKLSS